MGKMSIVWADFANFVPVLEHELQAMLRLPIAIAFKRNIDASVAMMTTGDNWLIPQLNVRPNWFCRLYAREVVLKFTVAVGNVLVILVYELIVSCLTALII